MRSATSRDNFSVTLLLFVISLYRRFISPVLPNACRFYPTCSCYAMQAVRRHGAMRGSLMAIKRVGRCHPWHSGGEDPVR